MRAGRRKSGGSRRYEITTINYRLPFSNGVVVRVTPMMMIASGLAGIAAVTAAGAIASAGLHPAVAVLALFLLQAAVAGAALPHAGARLRQFAQRRGKVLGRRNLAKIDDMASATGEAGWALLRISAAAAGLCCGLSLAGALWSATIGAAFIGLLAGGELALCRDTLMLPGRIERRISGGASLKA